MGADKYCGVRAGVEAKGAKGVAGHLEASAYPTPGGPLSPHHTLPEINGLVFPRTISRTDRPIHSTLAQAQGRRSAGSRPRKNDGS